MNTATTARIVRQPKQEAVAKRKLIYTGQKSTAEISRAVIVHSIDGKEKQW